MRRFIVALAFALAAALPCPAEAKSFDFSGWEALLKSHVKPGEKDGVALNLVDYEGMGKDPEFGRLISALAAHPLPIPGRDEKIAFWINVYNIFAVKTIIENPGVDSIKDIGSFLIPVWKREAGVAGGRGVTLDEIEHDILRPLGGPRIHAAIVCASVSCPDLRPEAYVPERLDDQLDDQMKTFLANTGKGLRIDTAARGVYLSSIFKWFAEDFESEGGVREFLARYLSPAKAAFARNTANTLIYMDYNWRLNAR